MTLRWEHSMDIGGDAWEAYSGELFVGFIVKRSNGEFAYKVTAVYTNCITKGRGETTTLASAKRAINRAWVTWLAVADLVPRRCAD